jgi:fatty acid desaturase
VASDAACCRQLPRWQPAEASAQEQYALRQPQPKEISMNVGLRSILLIVAIVCFVLAAIGVGFGAIGLVPLGLAFFAGAFLVGDGGLNLRS